MKKISASLFIIFLLFATVNITSNLPKAMGQALPFHDIDQSYAKESILHLHELNIMNGVSESTYSPSRPITRAEFITTLIRLLKLEPVNSLIPAYNDVRKSDWFYGTIQAATELGITEGMGNEIFAPTKSVTREETAKWIVSSLKQPVVSNTPNPYKDFNAVSSWAKPYVSTITELGLMQGSNGDFNPKQALTRQEAAMILDRIVQNQTWFNELQSEPEESIQMGWQYGQSVINYQNSITHSNVNVLSPRWYFLEDDSTISNQTVESLILWGKQNGKEIWPMVGNRLDQDATHHLLASSALTSAAIRDLKSFVTKYDLDGLNLDFENVHSNDRQSFTSFIASLAKELHSVHAVLSVDVSPDLGTDWTEAFDYAYRHKCGLRSPDGV